MFTSRWLLLIPALSFGMILWLLVGPHIASLPVYSYAQPVALTAVGQRVAQSPDPTTIETTVSSYITGVAPDVVYQWYRQQLGGSGWGLERETQYQCTNQPGGMVRSALFDGNHMPLSQDWEKVVIAVAPNTLAWTTGPATETSVILIHYHTRTWSVYWFDMLGAFWGGPRCN